MSSVTSGEADDMLRDVCIKRYAASCTDIMIGWLNDGISAAQCVDIIRALTPNYIYGAVYGGTSDRIEI